MSGTQPNPSSTSYELAPVRDEDTESAEPMFNRKGPQTGGNAHTRTISPQRWGLEILSVTASLTLFIGMFVIFFTMQDKPVSEWPFPISINAAIAVLSTACTAAMMHNVSAFIGQLKWLYLKTRPCQLDNIQTFDEASRGPYGSLMFLFKASWNMATLGAIITILRLGFSPMAQGVIDPKPRQVPIPDERVTFGFAHAYNRNVNPDMMGVMPPDPYMQSAIIKGLYDIKTSPIFNCSGSCSWDDRWVSLGFKSVCENVTTATLDTMSCDDDTARLTNKGTPQLCNMTTPSDIKLFTAYSVTQWGTEFYSDTSVLSAYPNQFSDTTDLIRVAILRSELDYNYREVYTDVTECTISYVTYEYTGAIADGNKFSFGRTRVIDLKWLDAEEEEERVKGEEEDQLDPYWPRRLISKPARADVPEFVSSRVDEGALTDFMKTETFRMNATSHGLGAILGRQVNVSQRFDKIASMSNARKHKVPLWKPSALVLLACQHDEDEGRIRGTTETVAELEKRAKSSRAKLE
ncbi:unnamed protein product [Fusarium equiseti]|uniref:Uncharacterized protein n=1 Tax=Fusarium equiseti TaxID=61235 RepID=A0A8J2NFF5_FUSEQ|nr:unnamed protein product [Fusarium equiseti]